MKQIGFMFLIVAFAACTGAETSFARATDELTAIDQIVQRHLPYIYGSEDLSRGGLDCSGFVQIVFRESNGLELPNEADKQLDYCRAHGQVWDSTSGWVPSTLQPGDLIFFAGPDNLPRASLVTHVMIYCGHNTMAGAQGKGRQKDGAISGVGYYYFLPRSPSGVLGESGERFIGHRRVFAYGRLGNTLPHETIVATTEAPTSRHIRVAASRSSLSSSHLKLFGSNSRVD